MYSKMSFVVVLKDVAVLRAGRSKLWGLAGGPKSGVISQGHDVGWELP